MSEVRLRKLTPASVDALAGALATGVPIAVAAEVAGITSRTFHLWMRAAAEPDADPRLVELRRRVLAARTQAEASLSSRINRAARNGSWRAAAWLLERRHPSRWAPVRERGRARDHARQFDPEDHAELLHVEHEHRGGSGPDPTLKRRPT